MRIPFFIAVVALVIAAFVSPVQSFDPGEEITGYAPVDQQTGWLLTTSRLLLTRDRGASWSEVGPELPAGEALLAADFVSSGRGWAVLGRAVADGGVSLRLARSALWGAGWDSAPLPLFAAEDPDPTIAVMQLDFATEAEGTLRVRHVSSSNFERWSEWTTSDGGESSVRAGGSAAAGATAAEGARFAGPLAGWRVDRAGACEGSGGTRVCRQSIVLAATADGGETWSELPLPPGVAREREWAVREREEAAGAASMGSRTMISGGQGFDKCEVATPQQLWDWRWNSPYNAVNLYIGGSMRACSNKALSADYLRTIASMGWTFIPTWVGPQSPCYGGSKGKMNLDPAVAQGQGWSEAMAASDTATRLGLTDAGGTGSIVYYDMEYYNTSDGACNAAVQAFVTGWTQGMRTRGNLAGVYGTGSTLRLLANIAPAPDAIWAAHWIRDAFDPYVSVWNVYTLSNDLWVNHQRLRQYTGGHWETWGSAAMNVDANALDGVVAVMDPPAATPTPTATPTSTPTRIPFTPQAWHYLPVMLR